MTPPYRALCAELADVVYEYCILHEGRDHLQPLVARARALLAQLAPEEPTDEDLEDLADVMNVSGDPVPAMRRALELWGRPTPQPVAEGPTNEELTLTYAYAVAAAVDNKRGPFTTEAAEAAQLAGLRAVLAKWGNQ